jgi:hypothetical protein
MSKFSEITSKLAKKAIRVIKGIDIFVNWDQICDKVCGRILRHFNKKKFFSSILK